MNEIPTDFRGICKNIENSPDSVDKKRNLTVYR